MKNTTSKKRIFLEYSDKCNAAPLCTHCQGAPFKYEASLKDNHLLKVVSLAKENNLHVTLTGGDPSAYPNVARILESENIEYTLMTNGVKRIKKIKPTKVILSYDAEDVRPYDQSNVLTNCIDYKSNLTITTCISKKTDLVQMYEQLYSYKEHINHWRISFINNSGNAVNNAQIMPDFNRSFKELAIVLSLILEKKPFLFSIKGIWFPNIEQKLNNTIDFEIPITSNPCKSCSGQKSIAINAKGEIQYCPLSSDVIGNIEDPTSEILFNKSNKNLNRNYDEWKSCINCRYFKLCGGGCPAKAKERRLIWNTRDEIYCMIMFYWEKWILPSLPNKLQKQLTDLLNEEAEIFFSE